MANDPNRHEIPCRACGRVAIARIVPTHELFEGAASVYASDDGKFTVTELNMTCQHGRDGAWREDVLRSAVTRAQRTAAD